MDYWIIGVLGHYIIRVQVYWIFGLLVYSIFRSLGYRFLWINELFIDSFYTFLCYCLSEFMRFFDFCYTRLLVYHYIVLMVHQFIGVLAHSFNCSVVYFFCSFTVSVHRFTCFPIDWFICFIGLLFVELLVHHSIGL